MAEPLPQHEAADHQRWRAQFSLRTLLVAVNAVAMSLAMFAWIGKDGWLLAGIVVPGVTVFSLPLGSIRRKLHVTVIATLMAVGIVWSLLFPKNTDVLRPDTFASILTGIGLIGAAMLLIAVRRRSAWLGILVVALLWSLLLNLVQFNQLYHVAKSIRHLLEQRTPPLPPQPTAGPAASEPEAENTATEEAESSLGKLP